ncbi:MAG: SUF system Fe-S cluster assembly protein [Candidatus Competibacterales bacterium]
MTEPVTDLAPLAESGDVDVDTLEQGIIEALKGVYDPEIPVNIYDLGLIYEINVHKNGEAEVFMTLTAPGCPVAGEMPGWVQEAVESVDGVKAARVDLVWEPPWTPELMSLKAKLELNMF